MIRALCLLWGCTFAAIVALKLAGIVTASWAWVLSPLWIPALLTVGALVGAYVVLTRQGRPL
jgi:hypothetical protein